MYFLSKERRSKNSLKGLVMKERICAHKCRATECMHNDWHDPDMCRVLSVNPSCPYQRCVDEDKLTELKIESRGW